MTGGFLNLKDVLADMRKGSPFSIEWVSADIKRKTAGRWLEVKAAVLSASSPAKKPGTRGAEEKAKATTRLPRSIENDTINITSLANQRVITVHVRLIKVYNGKTVIY